MMFIFTYDIFGSHYVKTTIIGYSVFKTNYGYSFKGNIISQTKLYGHNIICNNYHLTTKSEIQELAALVKIQSTYKIGDNVYNYISPRNYVCINEDTMLLLKILIICLYVIIGTFILLLIFMREFDKSSKRVEELI